jgi:ABC-2 type transport system ATP-binding protein
VLVSIQDVYKTYRLKNSFVEALKGVSLDIYKGEIVALLGVNGAGKTTLSSILATLHPVTSGTILFKNVSMYDNLIAYRKALGFCPQRPNLDKMLNVEENLWFAGRYFLMPESEIQSRTEFLLDQFNLIAYRKAPVDALSGGYKQRLLIARAMMHKPELLILDEPTVGLDPDIRRSLWKIIKSLKELGITVILTTHYLDEAEVLADRVCMLSRGSIIMTATVQDLKELHKKETLEEVFLHMVKEQNGEGR